jgi:hypothetical protein
MTEAASTVCQWCEKPFRPRRGGSPQRFCGSKCRATFWSALRRWGERAVAAGILTIDDIKNSNPRACTLLLAARSPGAVGEAHGRRPAAIAPGLDSRYTAQKDLERRIAQAIATRRR